MQSHSAFIIVDVQNDFCEGGSLQVEGGGKVASRITKFVQNNTFDLIVTTQDWHPANHRSFCSNNQQKGPVKLFETIKIPETGQMQVMWPDHCIQNSEGAEFHPNLEIDFSKTTSVKKGTVTNWDSYSGFGSEGEETGLDSILKNNNIGKVFVAGLAFDYCVGATAIDAASKGYETFIFEDLTEAISEERSQETREKFKNLGGKIVKSSQYSELKQ